MTVQPDLILKLVEKHGANYFDRDVDPLDVRLRIATEFASVGLWIPADDLLRKTCVAPLLSQKNAHLFCNLARAVGRNCRQEITCPCGDDFSGTHYSTHYITCPCPQQRMLSTEAAPNSPVNPFHHWWAAFRVWWPGEKGLVWLVQRLRASPTSPLWKVYDNHLLFDMGMSRTEISMKRGFSGDRLVSVGSVFPEVPFMYACSCRTSPGKCYTCKGSARVRASPSSLKEIRCPRCQATGHCRQCGGQRNSIT